MEKKVCPKCNEEKPLTKEYYHKDNNSLSGFRSACKVCCNEASRKKYKQRKPKKNKITLRYELEQKTNIRVCKKCNEEKPLTKEYYHKDKRNYAGLRTICKCCTNAKLEVVRNQDWYREYQERYQKIYRASDNGKKKMREARDRKRDRLKTDKEYRKKFYKKRNRYRRGSKKYKEWRRKNYKKNIHIYRWRAILHDFYRRKGGKKEGKTYDLLGYNYEQFKQRIEMNFQPGMSWDNYGEWHIDHIKPVSLFPDDAEARIVNALCNLQPLWRKDNLEKSNNFKIDKK